MSPKNSRATGGDGASVVVGRAVVVVALACVVVVRPSRGAPVKFGVPPGTVIATVLVVGMRYDGVVALGTVETAPGRIAGPLLFGRRLTSGTVVVVDEVVVDDVVVDGVPTARWPFPPHACRCGERPLGAE
jgi:hypothetical protein